MGKITVNELSPSLIQYFKDLIVSEIRDSGSGILPIKYLKQSVDLSNKETSITIPTSFEYNKSNDLLLVFKNSTYLEEEYDYTISSDSTTINMVTGTGTEWYVDDEDAPSCLFNLVVFKNISKA